MQVSHYLAAIGAVCSCFAFGLCRVVEDRKHCVLDIVIKIGKEKI